MDQKTFLYKYYFLSFRNRYFKNRRFYETKLNPNFGLTKNFFLRTHINFLGDGPLLLWHQQKKEKNTHFAPINFVHKRANNIRAGFSFVEKKSIKFISHQSRYKVDVSKRNILQIVNQSRETINIKQLLVSISNLRFTQSLFLRKRSYKSSYFYFIYPWGMQISDWHHRIQIKDLYPVTRKFPQTNQKYHKTKVNCYKANLYKTMFCNYACKLFLLRRKKFILRKSTFTPQKWKTLLLVLQSKTIFFFCIPNPLYIRFISASICEAKKKERRKTKKFRLYKSSYLRNPLCVQNRVLYVRRLNLRFIPPCTSQLQAIGQGHTCTYNSPESKSSLNFTKGTISNMRTKSSFYFTKKRLAKNEKNVILSISGGQDSSFLLFCLSFLQFQIAFKPKIIWCNHFWQKSSFYTTLHLTKSAMAFSAPVMGFIPFHRTTSPQLYQIIKTNFCSGRCTNVRTYKNTFCIFQRFVTRKKKQNKIFFFYKSIIKKHDKHDFYAKNNFYLAKIKMRNKKPKAYKKFIKKISETRARNWRHITIERACTFYGSRLCLNGHTLSDRVETVLFNLIRGAKKKNFQALPWKRRHSAFCYNQYYPVFEQVIKHTHIDFI